MVDGKLNVLNVKNSTFAPGMEVGYNFSSIAPLGISLKIRFEYIEGGNPFYVNTGTWAYQWGSGSNLKISSYDNSSNSQTFYVFESGKPSNLTIFFMTGENLKIRISYFENSEVANRTRIITVN